MCLLILTLVPTTVNVAAISQAMIGEPLTLQCSLTTVRGIDSSVDIIWSSNDEMLRRINDNDATIVNDEVVYTDNYTIQTLTTAYDGVVIECEVVINTQTPIRDTSSIELDVNGMYFIM